MATLHNRYTQFGSSPGCGGSHPSSKVYDNSSGGFGLWLVDDNSSCGVPCSSVRYQRKPPGHSIPSSRADAAGGKVGGGIFGTCGALGGARTVAIAGAFGGAFFGGKPGGRALYGPNGGRGGGRGASGGAFGGNGGRVCRAATTMAAVSSTVRWGQSGTRIHGIA